ncbi:phosphotransferase enzyme family protein [Paenibacillus marinisediminis]
MPNWQQQFNEELLAQAAQRIGVEQESIIHCGGFENVVYSFQQGGQDLILRVGHSSHRTVELMASEMHFMDYLAKHGVRIARPVAFPSGQLIETLESEDAIFILTMFEKAAGGHIDCNHKDWGPRLFEQWGEITGKMHALAQEYILPADMTARPHQDVLGFNKSSFGPEEHKIYDRLQEVDKEINALPHEAGAYGLCHRDLHHGNFYVHESNMIAFDFDDCGYDYYVQDIAMAVYYGAVFGAWRTPEYENARVSKLANELLASFMIGYNREYQLDAKWLKQLPLFVEKRRLELCLLLYASCQESSSGSPERKAWLKHNLQDIDHGVPCMELQL